MFEKFSGSARDTVKRARSMAVEEGAETVEAQHLLLALTDPEAGQISTALGGLGVTGASLKEALNQEYVQALRIVGVNVTQPPRGPAGASRSPRWGQSAKLALERTLAVVVDSGHKRIEDKHILIALSRAEVGVVPRVLKILGVSAADVEKALG